MDLAYDLKRFLPSLEIRTIVDVGANIGQSTDAYIRYFPNAAIWCFEPNSEIYSTLQNTYSNNTKIKCENIALGAKEGTFTLHHTIDPTVSYIAPATENITYKNAQTGTETVHMTTLDSYCKHHNLDQIDFLKIDTEGHDLDVLRGAETSLATGNIRCVQCECSLNPDNTHHVAFEVIKSFLENFKYRIFGIYEQHEEYNLGLQNLRRIDAVFISPATILSNSAQSKERPE